MSATKTDHVVRPRLVELPATVYVYLQEVNDGLLRGAAYRDLLMVVADLPDMGPAFYLRDFGEGSPAPLSVLEHTIENFTKRPTIGHRGWRPQPQGWTPPKTLKEGKYVLTESMTVDLTIGYVGPAEKVHQAA